MNTLPNPARGPAHGTARPRLARRVVPVAVASVAALGALGLVELAPAQAQRAEQPTIQTPFGRAPLSFADIVERVKPAVVSIHVSSGTAPRVASRGNRGGGGGGGGGGGRDAFPELPDDHPLNEFFKNFRDRGGRAVPQVPQTPRRARAQGSGFVISTDGFIVTNNHVISGAGKIEVSFDERRKLDAELVGSDPRTDLALLKIKNPPADLRPVKFAAKPVRVGDWVLAVGNPFGLGGTVTAGIVSALSRDIGTGPYEYMQIDAAVNKGNSGGPTFNLDGEVVGVNTAIYSPSGGNVGIAFAVPSNTASEVVEQLRVNKKVIRGWLGVQITRVDDDVAAGVGLGDARGALIKDVTAGGPAASSALRPGDVVVAVNGNEVDTSDDFARKIAAYAPGSTVILDVLRYGKAEKVSVKLGTFPTDPQVALGQKPAEEPKPTELTSLGITLTAQPAGKAGTEPGVVVKEVESDSDAAYKGIKAGDVIVKVHGKPVNSPAEVVSTVDKARTDGLKAVILEVRQGGQPQFVALPLSQG